MNKPSLILAIDIGGTKINSGLVRLTGEVLKGKKTMTQARGGLRQILENIIQAIQDFYSREVKAMGVGIAGEVDQRRGVLKFSPNFPSSFKNIPLKKILERRFQVPVFLDNDANCFTLAESYFGAAKNYSYVLGLTLGTGIGGGIVIEKKIYHGAWGEAGELGHITLETHSKERCSCGQPGHFEVLASGQAMVNFYKKLKGVKKDTFYIEQKAIAGEKEALKVIDLMKKYLSVGLANLIHIFNPEIIIIGGGMARVRLLWSGLLPQVYKRLMYQDLKKTKIVKSKLDDKAGLLGAALIANSKLRTL